MIPSMADRLFDLTGKVVLVTGGSRGLGKEIALGCAQMGADVVIASRKYENCVQAAQDLETATGRHALPYAAHIGRWDELDGLVSAAYGRFGKVDVLVNNAGMSPLYGELSSISEQLFDSVINVNFKGPFRLSALVGERMITDGGGSIVNVSSTGSVRPNPSIIPYAAAKAALNSMTEGLAQALGPTVRVNTLMSGAMMTDVAKAWSPETKASSGKRVALGRIGEPHEVVGAALYFASDASSYTTGATLRIDGGIP